MAARKKKYPLGSVSYFIAQFEAEIADGRNERLKFDPANEQRWRELLGKIAADNSDVESARALAEDVATHVALLRLKRIAFRAGFDANPCRVI